jgi:hypothetical protein
MHLQMISIWFVQMGNNINNNFQSFVWTHSVKLVSFTISMKVRENVALFCVDIMDVRIQKEINKNNYCALILILSNTIKTSYFFKGFFFTCAILSHMHRKLPYPILQVSLNMYLFAYQQQTPNGRRLNQTPYPTQSMTLHPTYQSM